MRALVLAILLAVAPLPLQATTGPLAEPASTSLRQLSLHQKNAALQPLMRLATECIARAVAKDPRFRKEAPTEQLDVLIVESMEGCTGVVRAMIDAYDRYFGDGTGEAFFMGPYLDVLPIAVGKRTLDYADH
jgi:hypothetical protein